MKNTIIATLFAAAALTVTSCNYVECLLAENPQECAAGKAIESAIAYLADAKQIDSQEKADAFASKWNKIQTAMEGAQKLGVQVPESAKKTYNSTLTRMRKHNYFESPTLQSAMQDARMID